MRRPWALPLVPLYWLGLTLKNAWYARHAGRVRRLACPVISVGSLSAGGAGKTPVVLMLVDLLTRYGVAADVLSRGYGRGGGVVEEVDPAGPAQRFGDEPLEMARRGVRVIVGADRHAAGTLAEAGRNPGIHILDDGFQHRKLARQVDIVLLTADDMRDSLLPAGNLREPLSSLGRADVVVLREEEEAGPLILHVRKHSQALIWTVRRELVLPAGRPVRPIVFCGLARPQGFAAMLAQARCEAAGEHFFPDHHAYTDEDFALLADGARQAGADGFITTAKDAVKIPADALARLRAIGPVVVAELRVTLLKESQALDDLRARLPMIVLHSSQSDRDKWGLS